MKSQKIKKLSIIVPVFNEILLIEQFVTRLSDMLDNSVYPYEVIFVDDNSTDGTYEFLKQLSDNDSVILIRKKGKKGKAFSLTEGFSVATGDVLVMIDGDLQYPPESIPEMLKKLSNLDIVVANRKKNDASRTRKFMSSTFRNFFGNVLFGLKVDIQSGLKVFRKEVVQTVNYTPRSGWTFDLEFLHRAKEAGYRIGSIDIHFASRRRGVSKINILGSSLEIGVNAFRVRMRKLYPMHIPSSERHSMIGAGIGYKRKQFLTHSTLPHHKSALRTFEARQIFIVFTLVALLTASFVYQPFSTLKYFIAFLSGVYFIDVLFNFYLIGRSLYASKEIGFTKEELDGIDEKNLPVYTILCPLYKEAHIIPHFLDSISKLDYPKNKLDVMLLLEEDDFHSISSVKEMDLPSYVRSVVVPHSEPKTKPKACNYGLSMAKGEYLVIYDAEDMPDVLQLKKAFLAFQKVDSKTICLQAKLNYYNPHQNLLTRFFTAEYSLWFDLTLTGLQTLNTSLPLGGTSNHFRVKDLVSLHGWDAFNVTEDADLGIRLFKAGYKTAMIDSTTLEEANSQYKNWIRQRSRWIKGYMQTYIVHLREMWKFTKERKHHALYFQLILGGKIAFILINPILWIATISYFALYSIVGPTIESLYPAVVFYMAVTSLVFGNFLFIYYYMIGVIKREQYSLVKYVYLVPIYWIMISIAGAVAFYQLIFKPHYWEKTLHGLHLKPGINKFPIQNLADVKPAIEVVPDVSIWSRFGDFRKIDKAYLAGLSLVVANVISNLINLYFNIYLGKTIDLKTFSLISLLGSIIYITHIPFSAVSATVNHRSGFLLGRYGADSSRAFWRKIRHKSSYLGIGFMLVFLSSTYFLAQYFHTDNILPFVTIAPIMLFGFLFSIDKGYLTGKLLFGWLALLVIVESTIKFASAYILINNNLSDYVYSVIPLSLFVVFILGWLISARLKAKNLKHVNKDVYVFPKKFFVASLFSGLSTVSFLSLDIILAAHFLSAEEAGIYALVSLVGKMIFFMGNLAGQFVLPLVSVKEGSKQSSRIVLYLILLTNSVLTTIGFFMFGIFGHITLPILFGERAEAILPYVVFMSFAMLCFSISRVFVSYHLARKLYTFSVVALLLAILQIVLISWNHSSINAIIFAMLVVGGTSFVVMTLLHINARYIRVFENNIADLLGLFEDQGEVNASGKLRILIYNWRDTHHKWTGGAEVYAQKLAERWVKDGNNVTIFCGNDSFSPKNQIVNGVIIKRRGGAYMVYFWAFLYYILKFRGKFDVIVDCENGIPFFTPLYSRIPVILLIHHVHQKVFREHLWYPVAAFASFLEGKMMPMVYRNNQVITVSQSSKKAIVGMGIARSNQVSIVQNGIDPENYIVGKKTSYPLFTYLGRLKPYKNIDIAIRAIAQMANIYSDVRFVVMGSGESMSQLTKLVDKLGISKHVIFTGKVSEKVKSEYLSKSWAVVQPSMIEGWGITVIEANASGTPVIASDVSGLKDAVDDGKTGVLVKVRDVSQMAKAMNTIILDNEYRKILSKNAYTWSKNFSWDKSAEQFYSYINYAVKNNIEKSIRATLAVNKGDK